VPPEPYIKDSHSEQPTHFFQIFRGVHPGARGMVRHMDRNAVTMPHGTQLLQRLDTFNGGCASFGKLPQKANPVAIDADVAQWRWVGQLHRVYREDRQWGPD
jgi:hypothetical protein